MSAAKRKVQSETGCTISQTCRADHAYILRTHCPKLGAIWPGEGVFDFTLELVVAASFYSNHMRGDIRQYVEGNIKESSRTTKVGGVRVHAVELGRALDECYLLRGKLGKTLAEHLTHVRRVMAEVDRVLSMMQRQRLPSIR